MANNKEECRNNIGAERDADNDKQCSDRESEQRVRSLGELNLDPWQEKLLGHNGNLLLCTGRQVGKTTILSRKACQYMIEHKNSRIIVVSLTEDQAQLIIIMMLSYLEKHYKNWLKKPLSKNVTKNKIILNNGSQVLSRPVGNTGDAVRGFTGDVLIVDEASRMPEQVWTASKPTLLTTNGQIWMCSTPFGKQGYFYECFKDGTQNEDSKWKVFHISSEKVMKERPFSKSWTKEQREGALRLLEQEKREMGEIAYSQEYLGMFMDDLRMFFSDDLIEKCCILRKPEHISRNNNYFLGLDIARMGGDEGTYEIIHKTDENRLYHIENIITVKKLTTETYDKILELNRLYDFRQIGIDAGAGSLGVGIMDFLLRNPEVSNKVVALNNREVTLDKWNEEKRKLLKEDMYQLTKALMENGTLKLLNDEKVRLSLRSIQIEIVKKEGQTTKVKIFGNYSHVVEGIIRAVWLANTKNINTFIDWI